MALSVPWTSVFIVAFSLQILSAINCERMEFKTESDGVVSTLIFPTTYCYSGSFSDLGIKYASTSFTYQCVSGDPYIVEYTSDDCTGDGIKTAIKDNPDYPSYSSYCGIDKCDVVQLTLYDGVSNKACLNATADAGLLDSYQRYSGAFLLDFCNYISDGLSLKLTCDGKKAKLLTYAGSGCKSAAAITTIDTSVAVNCNETTQALGTLTALSAQCEVPTKTVQNSAVIVVVIVIVVIVIAIAVAVYCYLQKKKKSDDKYSHLVGDNQDAQITA